jgi:hypothetical protein
LSAGALASFQPFVDDNPTNVISPFATERDVKASDPTGQLLELSIGSDQVGVPRAARGSPAGAVGEGSKVSVGMPGTVLVVVGSTVPNVGSGVAVSVGSWVGVFTASVGSWMVAVTVGGKGV